MKRLPERVFYSLNDIEKLWHADPSDLKQWLMHGQLKAHIWLPMMSVYEIREETEGARIILTKQLRHWEGYTPLYPHHCRKIFKSGTVYLREFLCAEENSKLALPDTAESLRFCINSLGAKLRGSDLALAQITAKWTNSLKIFEEFQRECKNAGFDYDLGIYIKNLIAFTTGQSRFKTVSSIPEEQLKQGWENSKRGINFALNFLKSNVGIDSPALLSTPYIIITVGYYAFHNDFNLTREQENDLRYWLCGFERGRKSLLSLSFVSGYWPFDFSLCSQVKKHDQ